MEQEILLDHLSNHKIDFGEDKLSLYVLDGLVKSTKTSRKSFNALYEKQEAASSDDGIKISPLVNTDRKGGAYPIMLQQFKRAIGVAIVRGNAKHKLARLHYVRATAAEAAYTCRTNHSDKKWNPRQTGRASWFSQHVPEGYGTFEQFRNGYDFSVH